MDTVEVLTKARKLIEWEVAWTRCAQYIPADINRDLPERRDYRGAIWHASERDSVEYAAALQAFRQVVQKIAPDHSPQAWHDHHAKHAEVLDAFDKAIALTRPS